MYINWYKCSDHFYLLLQLTFIAQVIRLRGELKEMQKKLFEAETRVETETQAHMEKVLALSLQITQLTNILQTHSIPL